MRRIRKIAPNMKNIKAGMIMLFYTSNYTGKDPFFVLGVIKRVFKRLEKVNMIWLDEVDKVISYDTSDLNDEYDEDIHIYEISLTIKRLNLYYNLFNTYDRGYYDIS